MKITKACDYAMRALLCMTNKPCGTVFMRSDLSKLSNVPDSFLGKIMQNLARSGILVSERGKKGGFRLEKSPSDITMYDVLTAVEGELLMTDCIADEDYCGKSPDCNVHKKWVEIQDMLTEKLSSISIGDLM